MGRVKIAFDPALSIKENSERAGVSMIAVQKYMERHGISARKNNFKNRLYIIEKAIQKFTKRGVEISYTQLAKETGFSTKTVKKYYDILQENKEELHTDLVYKFSASSSSTIKSVSTSQKEILENIIRLYIPSKKIDCDLTYSEGKMWKGLPIPSYRFDKFPQADDVCPLADVEHLTEKVDSCIADPPFVISYGGSVDETGKTKVEGSNLISDRFSCFRNELEMQEANAYLLSQAHQILNENGILIYKIQDTVSSGRQIFTHIWIVSHAQKSGFELLDIFILIKKHRLISPKHANQQHARKYHSYFLV